MDLTEIKREIDAKHKRNYAEMVRNMLDSVDINVTQIKVNRNVSASETDFADISFDVKYKDKKFNLSFSHSGMSLYITDKDVSKSEVISQLVKKLDKFVH